MTPELRRLIDEAQEQESRGMQLLTFLAIFLFAIGLAAAAIGWASRDDVIDRIAAEYAR